MLKNTSSVESLLVFFVALLDRIGSDWIGSDWIGLDGSWSGSAVAALRLEESEIYGAQNNTIKSKVAPDQRTHLAIALQTRTLLLLILIWLDAHRRCT